MWNLILSLSEYETRPFVRYALTVDFDPINVYCPEFLKATPHKVHKLEIKHD